MCRTFCDDEKRKESVKRKGKFEIKFRKTLRKFKYREMREKIEHKNKEIFSRCDSEMKCIKKEK
jgi:hypothetical protein